MNDNEVIGSTVVLCVVIVGLLVFIGSSMEANAFNKFSEKKATWIDALSIELRVEACR